MAWIQTEIGTLINTDHLSSIQKVDSKGMLRTLLPQLSGEIDELAGAEIAALEQAFGIDFAGVPFSEAIPLLLKHILQSTLGYDGEVRSWIITGNTPGDSTSLNILASFDSKDEASAYISNIANFLGVPS